MPTLAALLLVVLVASGCGTGGPEAADSTAKPCGETIVRDWADGAIDGAYPPDCYLAAIDVLPEDVRTYTSAVDDITRASQSNTGGDAETASGRADRRLSVAPVDPADPGAGRSLRAPPLPVLLLAVLGLLLLAAGLAATVTRRRRRSA